LVKEFKTKIFIISSALIIGLFLSFYKFPLSILGIFSFGFFLYFFLFCKKYNLSLWFFSIFVFYIAGHFYFSNILVEDNKIKEESELLTTIKKVEPYYYGYLNTAFNPSVGEFIFKTDKKYFSPGQVCLITFQKKDYLEYLNPFSMEKKRLLFIKGIDSELRFVKEKKFICEDSKKFILEKIRYRLFEFSEKLSGTARGLIQALVLGVEYNFPEEYKEKLKNQGLYHHLAISGFNLAILFGIFYQLSYNLLKFTPFVRTGYPLQNISYLLALPGAFMILLFSGFCPSAFRAFIFLALFVFTKLFFRNTSSLILLFLTATLILIFQPYLIGNLSFQLSFMATFGLIIGDRIFKTYFNDFISDCNIYYKILKHLFYLFIVSLTVSIFVFPFIAYINGSFPLVTPINNIIATFFWSFIFIPISILVAIFSFFNENIALELAKVLAYMFDLYIKIPFFEFVYKSKLPIILVILFIIISLTIFVIFSYVIKSYVKYFLWFIIILLFYFLLCYFYNNIFYILIFDVGRANAVLVKDKNLNILIDTGPNYFRNFNWTKTYLVPVLNKLGIDFIDLVILSHPDLDHSGGFETIRRYFFIKKVISGSFKAEDWEKANILILPDPIKTPEAIRSGEAEIFLFPGKEVYEDVNRESLVVYLEYKGLTVLFPGDIDKIRFYRMKENGEIFPVEVLISPHHGSKYSMDDNILIFIAPKVVLTSGRGKGFPHKDYLKVLKRFNIPHYSTEKEGAIFIFPKNDYFLICTERERRDSFLFSTFFPLVPLYLEEGSCKQFEYHKSLVKYLQP